MKTVRLPIYDDDGFATKDVLEIDLTFFISSTRGLRSNQARVISPKHKAVAEIEMVDRIISGLPARQGPLAKVLEEQRVAKVEVLDKLAKPLPPLVEWRPIEGFPRYQMNNNAVVQDVISNVRVDLVDSGRRARPSILLYVDDKPKLMDVSILFKRVFPELAP